MSCVPIAIQSVVFREEYAEGVRDTLACGHVVYSNTRDEEIDERRCAACLYTRRPRRPNARRRL